MLNSLIIGLGKIGCDYDYYHDAKDYILTHAQALQHHPSFRLIGGVDTSPNSREKFEKKFKTPTYNKLSNFNFIKDLDIVVVSVPIEVQLITVKKVLTKFSPKLILIEKPFSTSFDDAISILKFARRKNTFIAVNYVREFEPEHRKLFERINNDEIGSPIKAVCWYSKGLRNNGSHFIQLLSNFMGKVSQINVINRGRKWKGIDPEPTLEIIYEKGYTYFLPVMEEDYSFFEMELIGPKGKIKYYQGGTRYDIWKVKDDTVFRDSKRLELKAEKNSIDMKKYQFHVYDNISEYIKGNSALHCDGESALRTVQLINEVQRKLN